MPTLPVAVERRTKRWQEQRWILDSVIQALGIEWDQNRIGYVMAPCGLAALPDFTAVRGGVKKFNDMAREYGRAAARREKMARQFEADGYLVSARESYFIAALLYAAAMWPIFDNTRQCVEFNTRKVACYAKYAESADHPIRRVEIPLGDTFLPAWLHLPKNLPAGAKAPCVLATDGIDGFKEMLVSQYGDALLERGIAVLALDGPGQGECTVRNIHITGTNFVQAGQAALDYLEAQPEIDANRIGLRSVSMGSLWGTQLAAADPRIKAAAVAYVGHEPAVHTAFETASTTFKLRFMYMAGIADEAEFDRFSQTITSEGLGDKIQCPFLCVAGEDDDFSALEYTYALLNQISSPKTLLLYQGERHSLHTSSASARGPNELEYIANWLADRFLDKTARSEHILVDTDGRLRAEPWGEGPRHYEFGGIPE